MGGGDSGGTSGQPYDMMGGQYASFSGGTPSPFYQQPSFWASAGSGVAKSFGGTPSSSVAAPTNTPSIAMNQAQPATPGQIPVQQSPTDLVQALLRLLQTSGYGG